MFYFNYKNVTQLTSDAGEMRDRMNQIIISKLQKFDLETTPIYKSALITNDFRKVIKLKF